jgi:anaerobic selenocysteine-containing dehydrogenase
VWSVAALPLPELEGGAPNFGRWHSRVRGAPEILGQVPVSCLAEEITTPGPGQIRAVITVAGNPVLSTPDASRLDEALGQLDCMISVDNWLNETTRHAHVILPGLSPLEQPHHDELIWQFAVRSAAKWSDVVFDPGDRPREWEILITLAALCTGVALEDVDVAAIDDGFFQVLAMMKGVDPEHVMSHYDTGGPERLLDLTIRTGPFGDRYGEVPDGLTLAKVKAQPDGVDLGPMVPRLDEVLTTPDHRIRLAPEHITADLPRLRARLSSNGSNGSNGNGRSLLLVSRRDLRSNNSWMHNVTVLVKGKNRCTLQIHPDDASVCGVVDGGMAAVSSEAGALEVEVEVTDRIKPGVVCLPHGWGHDKAGTRLSVARERAGVNNNVLAPATLIDVPSGNAAVNGIPVAVAPVPA